MENGKSDGMSLQELGYIGLELPSCLYPFLTCLFNEMMLYVNCPLEGPQGKRWEEVIPANNHKSQLGKESFPSQPLGKTLIAACELLWNKGTMQVASDILWDNKCSEPLNFGELFVTQ